MTLRQHEAGGLSEPRRHLETLHHQIDRLAEQEPKLAEAKQKITDHVRGLSSDDQQALAPLLWQQLRTDLNKPHTVKAVQQSLQDGDRIAAAVDTNLAGRFSQNALQRMAQDARQRAQTDQAFAARMNHAREELLQTDTATETVLLAMLALIVLLCLIIIIIVSIIND